MLVSYPKVTHTYLGFGARQQEIFLVYAAQRENGWIDDGVGIGLVAIVTAVADSLNARHWQVGAHRRYAVATVV